MAAVAIRPLHRRSMVLNMAALSVLFVGYLLTSGTGILDSDGLKAVFRLLSLVALFGNLLVEGAIKVRFLQAIFFILFALLSSQSPLAFNIVFLILIAASLCQLSEKELAITLFLPTAMVVVLHWVLFATGRISTEVIEIADRSRSSFGFANANQVSVVYLSLVAIAVFVHIAFKQKLSFLLMTAAFVLSFYVFAITDSRTSLFSAALLLFLISLNYFFIKKRFYRLLSCLAGSLAPLIAVAITIYLTNSAGTGLDIVLSLRPYFFSEFIRMASGWDIVFGWNYLDADPVDNLFLILLSATGIINCTIILIFMSVRFYKMRIDFIPLGLVLIASSVFESFLLRPEIPCSVLFSCMLFSSFVQRAKRSDSR